MLQMWKLANAYARFAIVMYFALPALLIWLTWVAERETGGKNEKI